MLIGKSLRFLQQTTVMPLPYCSEFEALFSTDLIEEFSKLYGVDINILAGHLVNNINTKETLIANLYAICQRNSATFSPFHLGLGNPNALVLFVGKELGINTNDPNPPQLANTKCGIEKYYQSLYANEAILNYFLWSLKVSGHMIMPNCFFQDPEFASSFCHLYNAESKKKSGHYWRYINKAVSTYIGRDLNFYTNDFENSFFNYSFLTELNNTPSAKSVNKPLQSTIKEKFNDLTTIPFFRKFKRIVFSCRTYLRDNIPDYDKEIEISYNVQQQNNFAPTCNIREVYESSNQRIIVCNHIGGGAGWANEELAQLGMLLK